MQTSSKLVITRNLKFSLSAYVKFLTSALPLCPAEGKPRAFASHCCVLLALLAHFPSSSGTNIKIISRYYYAIDDMEARFENIGSTDSSKLRALWEEQGQ